MRAGEPQPVLHLERNWLQMKFDKGGLGFQRRRAVGPGIKHVGLGICLVSEILYKLLLRVAGCSLSYFLCQHGFGQKGRQFNVTMTSEAAIQPLACKPQKWRSNFLFVSTSEAAIQLLACKYAHVYNPSIAYANYATHACTAHLPVT